MKVKIVELFKEGIRIPRENVLAQKPVEGELSVDFMTAGAFSGQSEVLAARLRVAYGSRRIKADIIPPLFLPSLLKMTSGGFIVRGVQLSCSPEGVRQVVQEWWARPCS